MWGALASRDSSIAARNEFSSKRPVTQISYALARPSCYIGPMNMAVDLAASLMPTQSKGMYWQDRIIDLMLENPAIKLPELSRAVSKTVAWISTVRNSDSFRARYSYRRQQFNAELTTGIQTNLLSVGTKALKKIEERLDANTAIAIPIDTLVDTAGMALERLGYGVKSGGVTINNLGATNQQVVLPVSQEELAEARAVLRQAQLITAGETAPPPKVGGEAPSAGEIEGPYIDLDREDFYDLDDLDPAGEGSPGPVVRGGVETEENHGSSSPRSE